MTHEGIISEINYLEKEYPEFKKDLERIVEYNTKKPDKNMLLFKFFIILINRE